MKRNLNRLLILDGNHIAYRAYYKFSNLKDFDGNNTSVIFGLPRIVESLIRKFNPNRVFLVFDGGRSQHRTKLLPTYKSRDQKLGFDKDDFYSQKDKARDLIMALGVNVVWDNGEEADDLITVVAYEYSSLEWETIIVSGDKDFNQLISYDNPGIRGPVKVYNVGKNKLFEYENLYTYLPYKPEQCVDYLILTGDKSDNIPGYPGIGEVRGEKFLKQFGSILNFLASDETFGNIDKAKLSKVYRLNKKLINLRYYYLKYFRGKPIPIIGGESFNEKAFKSYCTKYETNSFLKPQFINTFKKLYYGKQI